MIRKMSTQEFDGNGDDSDMNSDNDNALSHRTHACS